MAHDAQFESSDVQLILHGLIDRNQWYAAAGGGLAALSRTLNETMYAEFLRLLADADIDIGAAVTSGLPLLFVGWLREHCASGDNLIAEWRRNNPEKTGE